MELTYTVEGLNELKAAIARNPSVVKAQTRTFFTRALALYRTTINRHPWRVGMSGGGAPVATGNLRDTHSQQIMTWSAMIRPLAPYAKYVHKKRPWLEYAVETNERNISLLEKDMLESIVADLAK